MKTTVKIALGMALLCSPTLAMAQSCMIDAEALRDARHGQLAHYAIASDIDCAVAARPAHQLLCASAKADGLLWQMAEFDDAAYVYAFENATGRETFRDNPPRDDAFIALRDACLGEDCLCAAYIAHTEASLGGLSPYQE